MSGPCAPKCQWTAQDVIEGEVRSIGANQHAGQSGNSNSWAVDLLGGIPSKTPKPARNVNNSLLYTPSEGDAALHLLDYTQDSVASRSPSSPELGAL